MSDLDAKRLEITKLLGATHTINAATEDALAAMHKVCPKGMDFSIECSGVTQVLESVVSTGTNQSLSVR